MTNFPDLTIPRGWECPKCGMVYAPIQMMCIQCVNPITYDTSKLTIENTLEFREKHMPEILEAMEEYKAQSIELPSDEEIEEELKNDISVSSRLKYITEEKDIKVAEFIIDYAFKDEKEVYTNGAILVPLFRVLDAISQKGNQYQEG